MPVIPDYLRLGAKAYRNGSRQHCVQTVQLSLLAEQYRAELLVGKHGGVPVGSGVTKIVRSRLKQITKDDAFASRAAGISQMAKYLADQGLKLDKVRSQGVLFAMLPCWEKAVAENRLTELMNDAAQLSISKFRKKWNKQHRLTRRPSPTTTLDRVVTWLRSNAVQNEVSQVYRLAAEILERDENL